MINEAKPINLDGGIVLVFNDTTGSPDRVELTIIDTISGDIVHVQGITAIKEMIDFCKLMVCKYDAQSLVNGGDHIADSE